MSFVYIHPLLSADVVQPLHLSTGTFSSYAAMALKYRILFCEITCLLLKINWGDFSQVEWMTVVYILTPIHQCFKVPIDILFPDTEITF